MTAPRPCRIRFQSRSVSSSSPIISGSHPADTRSRGADSLPSHLHADIHYRVCPAPAGFSPTPRRAEKDARAAERQRIHHSAFGVSSTSPPVPPAALLVPLQVRPAVHEVEAFMMQVPLCL